MTTVNSPDNTKRQAAAGDAKTDRPATERLREQAREVARNLEEIENIAGDAVQESLGQMRENASECFEHGREKVYKAERTFRQIIRDQPLKSILIAAAVGLFFGRVWKNH